MSAYRKSKALKKRYIKKNTGAKAQSKQILALSKKVNSLTKNTVTKFATTWQRDSLAIDSVAQSQTCYIVPIPYAPCDPMNTLVTNTNRTWRENLSASTGARFSKEVLFQAPQGIENCSKMYHTGGTIKWQMTSNEPAYSKVTLALISPKKYCADQLTTDRKFQTGSEPGEDSELTWKTDYVTHSGGGASTAASTYFGALINRKLWTVHYMREVAFSHPGGDNMAANVNPANTKPLNNSVVASGTIKVPAGKLIKNVSNRLDGTTNEPINAIQVGYLDQQNENACYLIAIQNGAKIDGEVIHLGFRVIDYYTCVN